MHVAILSSRGWMKFLYSGHRRKMERSPVCLWCSSQPLPIWTIWCAFSLIHLHDYICASFYCFATNTWWAIIMVLNGTYVSPVHFVSSTTKCPCGCGSPNVPPHPSKIVVCWGFWPFFPEPAKVQRPLPDLLHTIASSGLRTCVACSSFHLVRCRCMYIDQYLQFGSVIEN